MTTLYNVCVPVLKNMLTNLAAILHKGADSAARRNIAPEVFIQARLAPDMFPLVRQIQIATDMAKAGAARLAGVEPPCFEDTETTFAELDARIAKTITFLAGLDPAQFKDAETRDIQFSIREHAFHFKGEQYLLAWVLPNFYFHVTTAYAILRANGVDLGKRDFLGDTSAH